MSHLLLLWFAAASPDGHRLAVLVEASSAAVDVGVGGRRHRLLPGPDRLGCGGGRESSVRTFQVKAVCCRRCRVHLHFILDRTQIVLFFQRPHCQS